MKVKLAIDFGSANMKMVGVIEGKIYKKMIKSQATTNHTSKLSDKNIVEFNNKTVYFGTGNPLVKKNKIEREFVIESILLATNAIYGDLDSNYEVQLAIGLPLNKYTSSDKDNYLNILQTEYLNKQITGILDGRKIKITITYINIYAEGYSGFLSLMKRINTKNPLLIVDVGYKTTDIVGIKYDTFSNGLIVDNYDSIEVGMLEIFNLIRKQFINDTGMLYQVDTIEDSMLNKTTLTVANKEGSKEVDTRQWLKYGLPVLKNIFSKIEAEIFPDMKTRRIYLIGGGVEFIYKLLQMLGQEDKYNQLDLQVSTNVEESMFANVFGYLQQLERDVMKIVESADVFVTEKKLKGVALAEE